MAVPHPTLQSPALTEENVMTLAETGTETLNTQLIAADVITTEAGTTENGHTPAVNTEPIDISWEEVGPKDEPERPVEPSSWEDVDRRVRSRISDAMTLAENQFAG